MTDVVVTQNGMEVWEMFLPEESTTMVVTQNGMEVWMEVAPEPTNMIVTQNGMEVWEMVLAAVTNMLVTQNGMELWRTTISRNIPVAAAYQFANFVASEILAGVSSTDTDLLVPGRTALALPAADGTTIIVALVLWDGQLPPEIVTCTNNPFTGHLTVLRGQEGTIAQEWPAGTQIICTITAAVINQAINTIVNLIGTFLPLAGGTMVGDLILNEDPSVALQAATKNYVDITATAAALGFLPLSGGTMSGNINMNSVGRILALLPPVAGSEPATKTYADGLFTSLQNRLKDVSGKLVTAGAGTPYTLATNTNYTAGISDMALVAVRIGAVNPLAPTITVDGQGPFPIRFQTGVDIPAGRLFVGSTAEMFFNSASNEWLIKDFIVNDVAISTGFVQWRPTAEDLRPSWVRANGLTLGNGISGGTEFADPQARAIFVWLYLNFTDTQCPVSGGRTGVDSAAANNDFNSNKTITLLDMRGMGIGGIASMGNSASGRYASVPIVTGAINTPGSVLGENLHTLLEAELATHDHPITDLGHLHDIFTEANDGLVDFGNTGNFGAGGTNTDVGETRTAVTGITVNNAGADTPHNTVALEMLGTFYIKT